MAVLTAGIGVFILHAGVEMVTTPPKITHLGQDLSQEVYMQGSIIIGLGIALLAASAKLLAVAIEEAFFPESLTPEEVWEDMSISLQARLHFTVGKGYSRVVMKDNDLHEMMRIPDQKHVRFVGKKNGIVSISRSMSKFIAQAPDDEIRAFRATPAVIPTSLPESFWTPSPTVAVPAQNY
jgi:hypothetical protein